jgi:hypothetical protein
MTESVARRLVVGLVVAGVTAVAVAVYVFTRPPDRGPDAAGDRPEEVALAFVVALDTRDYATLWEHASDYERAGRSRDDYIAYRTAQPCPEPCPQLAESAEGAEGAGYDVAYVREEGPWTRVGVRRPPGEPPLDDVEVMIERDDDLYRVTATGSEGFDLDDTVVGGGDR